MSTNFSNNGSTLENLDLQTSNIELNSTQKEEEKIKEENENESIDTNQEKTEEEVIIWFKKQTTVLILNNFIRKTSHLYPRTFEVYVLQRRFVFGTN